MNTLSTPSYNDDRYSIYKLYNNDAYAYYLCMPNNNVEAYRIYIGFPTKELDAMGDELEIIESEIKPVYNKIYEIDRTAAFILPDISTYDLIEAASVNDNKPYSVLYRKINSIGSDAYDTIKGNTNSNIFGRIHYIKQNDCDRKFIDWIEINGGAYVKGIELNGSVGSGPQMTEAGPSEPQVTKVTAKKKALTPSKKRI